MWLKANDSVLVYVIYHKSSVKGGGGAKCKWCLTLVADFCIKWQWNLIWPPFWNLFFISFLDADFVTSLHHIDNFIYFFFRETAVETRKVNPSI